MLKYNIPSSGNEGKESTCILMGKYDNQNKTLQLFFIKGEEQAWLSA